MAPTSLLLSTSQRKRRESDDLRELGEISANNTGHPKGQHLGLRGWVLGLLHTRVWETPFMSEKGLPGHNPSCTSLNRAAQIKGSCRSSRILTQWVSCGSRAPDCLRSTQLILKSPQPALNLTIAQDSFGCIPPPLILNILLVEQDRQRVART